MGKKNMHFRKDKCTIIKLRKKKKTLIAKKKKNTRGTVLETEK